MLIVDIHLHWPFIAEGEHIFSWKLTVASEQHLLVLVFALHFAKEVRIATVVPACVYVQQVDIDDAIIIEEEACILGSKDSGPVDHRLALIQSLGWLDGEDILH